MPRCQTSPRGWKSLGTFSVISVSVIGPRFAIKNIIFLACARPKGLKYHALNRIIIVFGSSSRMAHINLCKPGTTWGPHQDHRQKSNQNQSWSLPNWRFGFGVLVVPPTPCLFLFFDRHKQRRTQNSRSLATHTQNPFKLKFPTNKKITYFTGLFLGFAFSTACKQKKKM